MNNMNWYLATEITTNTWSSRLVDPYLDLSINYDKLNKSTYERSALIPVCRYLPSFFVPFVIRFKVNRLFNCKKIKILTKENGEY